MGNCKTVLKKKRRKLLLDTYDYSSSLEGDRASLKPKSPSLLARLRSYPLRRACFFILSQDSKAGHLRPSRTDFKALAISLLRTPISKALLTTMA